MNSMANVMIVAEGTTEQRFVEVVLAPYLATKGVYVRATQISKKGQKGGDVRFGRAKRDVVNFLKERADLCVATFIDFYGVKEWPGLDVARSMNNPDPHKIASVMNAAAVAEICRVLPDVKVERRYIPFTSVHEFESLLFSDASVLSSELGIPLQTISATLAECGSPELINNHPETAPSKRLEKWTGGHYRKTTQGIVIAQKIGVDAMRKACPNFDDWLLKVEAFQ